MNAPDLPATELTEAVESLWGAPLQPAGCPVCKAVYLVPVQWLGRACPHCLRGRLEAQPAWLRREPPELLAPFRVQRGQLEGILAEFTRGVWLHPDDFTPRSLLQRAMPVFWPMWLVDAGLVGDWEAETGYEYQVKSSQESFVDGAWHTREQVEARLRWEPRAGTLERRYENVSVPAVGDHPALTLQTGAYRPDQAVRYDPTQVGPAALRVPDIQPESAWPQAQTALKQAAAEDCRKAAGAQQVRNFAIRAGYENLHWTQMLLPMYVTFYTDDAGQPQVILVNGQTGRAGGPRLASQRKGWRVAGILAGVALLLLVSGLLMATLGALIPPVAALGALLAGLAFLVGAAALVPAIWPWAYNRGRGNPARSDQAIGGRK